MLLVMKSMKELAFGKLMDVYLDGNRENGETQWPEETEARQLQLAEQAFYAYLRECFFRTEGAWYAVWEENGAYASAVRFEPYRDGLLLEALETAPEKRRKGYAELLLRAIQQKLSQAGECRVYSHVSKKNLPSLAIHKKLGFWIIADHAAYIDGSVNSRAYTLLWESKNFRKTENKC